MGLPGSFSCDVISSSNAAGFLAVSGFKQAWITCRAVCENLGRDFLLGGVSEPGVGFAAWGVGCDVAA